MSPADLPIVNACLNGLSACFLGVGYYFIRRKNQLAHRKNASYCIGAAVLTPQALRFAQQLVSSGGLPAATYAFAPDQLSQFFGTVTDRAVRCLHSALSSRPPQVHTQIYGYSDLHSHVEAVLLRSGIIPVLIETRSPKIIAAARSQREVAQLTENLTRESLLVVADAFYSPLVLQIAANACCSSVAGIWTS